MTQRMIRSVSLLLLSLTVLAACGGPAATTPDAATATPGSPAASTDPSRPAGWTDETHGNNVDPNYAVVFPSDKVNQLTITIDPASWQAMQANMTELFGEPGSRGMGRFPGAGGVFTDTGDFPFPGAGGVFTDTGDFPFPDLPPFPGAGGVFTDTGDFPFPGGGMGDFATENPMWVTATIQFAGQTWTNVGVRYKGNSSLMSAWNSQSAKLPFKLDFDEFEDDYPAIKNQRFYGFKQLSLSSNVGDPTGMRETIAYDVFAAAGLPAAETAAYEVILDHGDGPQSLGLYTMVEVIDDTVIGRVFGDDSGNIYEADGRAASLASGTKDQIADSFQKENNRTTDWSDIMALYDVLHDPQRTSDPAAWRAKLEAIFDVPSFLKWLGASAILEHWDTYGAMTHNYYLYNNPATGKLTWISWDHNFILGANMGMGGPGGRGGPPPGQNAAPGQGAPGMPGGQGPRGDRMRGGMNQNVTFDRANVNQSWPLIRYLLDDPTYYAAYIAALRETSATVFSADALVAKYSALAQAIAPVAAKETSQADYDAAVQTLLERLRTRADATTAFLATQ